jgi:uncharacterized protein
VGTYVRNPPKSRHRPGSVSGCIILVKLWQFDPDDRTQITINTGKQPYIADLTRRGVSILSLFSDDRETVQLERWEANISIDLLAPGGLEIFVIQGGFSEGGEVFQLYSWLRLPPNSRLVAQSGSEGCQIWLKLLRSPLVQAKLSATSPFHQGEQAIQSRLGVQERMEQPGRRAIRNYLTAQHQQFFAQLPYVIVGTVDDSGCPWATFLAGKPGFVAASDEYHLQINSQLIWCNPLATNITNGSDVGVLGIELHTRRRNRLSGVVTEVGENGIQILVKQSYGNCPQYIQARVLELAVTDQTATKDIASKQLERFDSITQSLIAKADTCFITTAYLDETAGGVDVSHRGGKPGFVRVDDDKTLTIPDFAGNYYFNTFGNLELNDRAGLLFLNFDQGDFLYLTGRAKVIWEGSEISDYAGAQRLFRFYLDHGYHVDGSLNLHWSAPQFSSFLDHTGSW